MWDGLKNENFIITTDLETDDIVALWILSKFQNIVDAKILFVVGEGDKYIKYIRMCEYVKILGFKNAEVVTGCRSNKLFKCDGYDIMSPEKINELKLQIENNKSYKHNILYTLFKIEEYILLKSTIISLKPPRELIMMKKLSETNQELFKNFDHQISECEIAGYMGFNLRCLMKEYDHKTIIEFLNGFKKCLFYETYHAIGNNNIITNDNIHMDKLPDIVKNIMKFWNKYMADDCLQTYKKLENKTDRRSIAKHHRNKKVYDDIINNNFMQFINADSGLIISLIDNYKDLYIPCTLIFDEKTGYSKITHKNHTNIHIIHPKNKESYRLEQIKYLRDLL